MTESEQKIQHENSVRKIAAFKPLAFQLTSVNLWEEQLQVSQLQNTNWRTVQALELYTVPKASFYERKMFLLFLLMYQISEVRQRFANKVEVVHIVNIVESK